MACPADQAPVSGDLPLPGIRKNLAAGKPIRILAIGSSSTEGIGASSPGRAYPALLQSELRRLWKADDLSVINAGVGGETVDQTLGRLDRAVSGPVKPALVIWQVGTNDAVRGGDIGLFRRLLRAGIAKVRGTGIDMILLDQQFFPKIKNVVQYEHYVAMVREAAEEARIGVFSRYALMRAWNARDPELLRSMLAGDAFHMADRGYACLAQGLGASLDKAIGGKDIMARTPRLTPDPEALPRRRT